MNFRKSQHKSDLDMLLEQGRVIPPLPGSVRTRALARARSIGATSSVDAFALPAVTRHRSLVITLAASVAFIVGAAGAAVVLRGRTHTNPPAIQAPSPQSEPAACATPATLPPVPELAPQPSVEPKVTRAEASVSARESYTAELSLLQRAQAAYADHNFATTLLLVSEHTRRFPNGRLVEEREALHVKALVGAGRETEAHRAATTFASRFPRSALLPRLSH
jgi:hypothetical protein